jgi:putative ABC transport system permease protein
MSGPMLRLALRSLAHHKVRTVVLSLCIALVGVLPAAVDGLLDLYRARLEARALSTPLVVGAPGSRSDLLIHALYYRGEVERTIEMKVAMEAGESGLGVPIPIHLEGSVNQYPLVGTTPDYQEFRGIRLAQDHHWPQRLAEAALGAGVARSLDLTVGDTIATDVHKLHDLAGSYPLLLKVTAVLPAMGNPDDDAVFVSLHTSWVVTGEGHGHLEIDPEKDFHLVLESKSNHVTASAAVVEAVEVTPENEDSFHFHGDPDQLPITALIIDAKGDEGATILRSRFRRQKDLQTIDSMVELKELLTVVMRAKAILDANSMLVIVATTLLLMLIVTLDVKVREREVKTLERIGAPRGFVARLLFTEVSIVVLAGGILSYLLAIAAIRFIADGPLLLP